MGVLLATSTAVFWSVISVYNMSLNVELPLKEFPSYKECGDAIPAMSEEYFPSGLKNSGWLMRCTSSGVRSNPIIPRLRPNGLTN